MVRYHRPIDEVERYHRGQHPPSSDCSVKEKVVSTGANGRDKIRRERKAAWVRTVHQLACCSMF